MKILFFDDDLRRQRSFLRQYQSSCDIVCAVNVKEVLTALDKESPFDLVCLDHDMDGQTYQPSGPGTGYEVAQYIAKMPVERQPKFSIVHSFNEFGAPLMVQVLESAPLISVWLPFNTPEFTSAVSKEVAKAFSQNLVEDGWKL